MTYREFMRKARDSNSELRSVSQCHYVLISATKRLYIDRVRSMASHPVALIATRFVAAATKWQQNRCESANSGRFGDALIRDGKRKKQRRFDTATLAGIGHP